MQNKKKLINKRSFCLFPSVIVCLIMGVISFQIISGYAKLYDDVQYADMMSVSESLSTQVYNSMMKSFSRAVTVGELLSSRGIEVAHNEAILEGLCKDTHVKGILFAPDDEIKAVYPENSMSEYLGLRLSENFPEKVSRKNLEEIQDPMILGPFETPESGKKVMASIAPYAKNGAKGREYCGHVLIVVDYPEIFEDVDFSAAENKNILCKIWRYDENNSKTIEVLQTAKPFPKTMGKNTATFQKVYLTTYFNYSLVPEFNFFQTKRFAGIVVVFLLITITLTYATYSIMKGIENTNELNMYKVQNQLLKVQEHTIISLSNLVENRDSDTGEHVRRTSDYVYMIAQEAQKKGLYTNILTDEYIEILKNAAPMHDIGKIVVPDAILKKPGKLEPEEFEQIKMHTTAGAKIISEILGPVQTPAFVTATQEIAESHHEKWNGKGYPCGINGDEIPLCARLMAVADVYDALVSKRCYKQAMTFDEATEIIKVSSGSHFDPVLVDLFLEKTEDFKEIAERYKD